MKKYRFKRNIYIENKVISYFQENRVNLNFEGLNEMISSFKALDTSSLDDAHYVTIDLALWIDYLESIQNAIETKLDFLDMKQEICKAHRIKNKKNELLENEIKDYTSIKKHLKLFNSNLKANIRYLNNAFWISYKIAKKNGLKLKYMENI